MNYGKILPLDSANGPGIRTVLFVSGCTHHCKGCFQPETHDFNYGTPFTDETIEYILKCLLPDYISGITLLGGDPLEKENIPEVLKLVKKIRERYFNKKTIWIYSGSVYEDLLKKEDTKNLLSLCDVLVDGPFIEEKKNLMLPFRGSSNQRIINLRTFTK